MSSQAKVAANRRNAKKSTGPRSTQGKAIVAQNALKHGLRARRDVVGGEDPAEFERWHIRLLTDLSPRGEGEGMIAEHIAGLSWRLRRAQRVQNEAFEYLLANELKDSLKYLPDEMTAEDEQRMLDDPEQDPRLAAGRMALKDYRYHGGTLDRLMVYERRIEQSLSKMINNLCKLRLSRQDDGGQSPPYKSEPLPRAGESVKQSQATDEGVRSVPVRAYQETPYGVTTNESQCAEQSQESSQLSVVSCQQEAGSPAGNCELRTVNSSLTPYGVTANASDCAEQSQPSTEGNEPITPRVAPPNSFDGAVSIPPDAAKPHGPTSLPVPPGESAEQSQLPRIGGITAKAAALLKKQSQRPAPVVRAVERIRPWEVWHHNSSQRY